MALMLLLVLLVILRPWHAAELVECHGTGNCWRTLLLHTGLTPIGAGEGFVQWAQWDGMGSGLGAAGTMRAEDSGWCLVGGGGSAHSGF